MHMADALLSPAVGATMWAATAAATVYCSAKVRRGLDDRKVPLMGVLAAFIFAAQMINFTIPGTGSSGHLGGGLLLAILLGPPAAFLAMASVLTVQALFFADGGLLALGCNIINLGLFPCFIAYPLIYKRIVSSQPTRARLLTGSLIGAIVGLQLGAFAVVMETTLSGVAALPFSSFLLLMQPIHLAIGIVEGLVTAGVVSFIWQARPEILERAAIGQPLGGLPIGKVLIAMTLATVLTGGYLSWYASAHPDGLEWAMSKVAGREEPAAPASVHQALEGVQEQTALLPEYGF
ncbi:MAG TPA: energy-coupling factor ABC transporter permease, partial [Desulfurivibrionaceae bacterium]|nr:energy-coupling factor ABC transporter permease [Desulfurivibrionaceae bacterium]